MCFFMKYMHATVQHEQLSLVWEEEPPNEMPDRISEVPDPDLACSGTN